MCLVIEVSLKSTNNFIFYTNKDNNMVIKKIDAKFCDVEKCGKPATQICALCKKDLCELDHTHSFGDGSHMEHAIPITIIKFPYGGPEQIYLCPQCFTSPIETSLFKLFEECGEQLVDHDGMG